MTNPQSSDHQYTDRSSRPRRIAFCITDLDAGGAEKALFQLVTGLDRKEWTPTVYCLGPEAELAPLLRERGIRVHCYGARGWRGWGVFGWLTKHLRELQPELLQCFLFHGNLVGRIAGKRAGVPIVLAGHRVAEREKRWHLWLDRWTRGLVDHHVCVSRGVANHVLKHLRVRPEQISVIPNGVAPVPKDASPPDLRAEFGFDRNDRVILAVGRLHPQKGFLFLLKAFSLLHRNVPASRLLIVGDGPQRAELVAAAQREQLPVQFAGYRRDVPAIMRQSDVLAMPSQWEGMPNVVLEAMQAGLPVVTTDVEGISDLVGNEQQGLVVTRGDARGFAAALQRILTEAGLASRLAESAQNLVETEFTWQKSTEKYDLLFRRLID
ncbi:glycosyltransferase [Planctomicrobium sp. SH661]|uniref:glycosyltransferase n=1 Tax=Planctomicrobium sp. SH661 TaxID=3448124 RepID=UPI003F5B11F9